MLKTPLEEHQLLHRFVNGDDAYRNSRFKLIPYISKVSVHIDQLFGYRIRKKGHFPTAYDFSLTGIMDRQTERWKESMSGGSSTRNELFPRKELPGGTTTLTVPCFSYIDFECWRSSDTIQRDKNHRTSWQRKCSSLSCQSLCMLACLSYLHVFLWQFSSVSMSGPRRSREGLSVLFSVTWTISLLRWHSWYR